MISLHGNHGPYAITVWEEASAPSGLSQDASLVRPGAGGTLRVAAIDGVSPHRSRRRAGVDDAVWAAGVTRAALSAPFGLAEAAGNANRELHSGLADARAEAQACLVAADVGHEGGTLVRAGDCEAWVRRAGAWSALLVGDHLLPDARRSIADWENSHPGASLEELLAAESDILAEPRQWLTTPIGRCRNPLLQAADLPPDWEALCLATDGARLNPDALMAIPRWLEGLRAREAQLPSRVKPHDDVTVVLVERA